jgi:hypothetical protein
MSAISSCCLVLLSVVLHDWLLALPKLPSCTPGDTRAAGEYQSVFYHEDLALGYTSDDAMDVDGDDDDAAASSVPISAAEKEAAICIALGKVLLLAAQKSFTALPPLLRRILRDAQRPDLIHGDESLLIALQLKQASDRRAPRDVGTGTVGSASKCASHHGRSGHMYRQNAEERGDQRFGRILRGATRGDGGTVLPAVSDEADGSSTHSHYGDQALHKPFADHQLSSSAA